MSAISLACRKILEEGWVLSERPEPRKGVRWQPGRRAACCGERPTPARGSAGQQRAGILFPRRRTDRSTRLMPASHVEHGQAAAAGVAQVSSLPQRGWHASVCRLLYLSLSDR